MSAYRPLPVLPALAVMAEAAVYGRYHAAQEFLSWECQNDDGRCRIRGDLKVRAVAGLAATIKLSELDFPRSIGNLGNSGREARAGRPSPVAGCSEDIWIIRVPGF